MNDDEQIRPIMSARAERIGTRAISSMVVISFFTSFITLGLVLLSYWAIPARIEAERLGRMEELQAMSELVVNVQRLTESVNARIIQFEKDQE